jgi:hypothetical protein
MATSCLPAVLTLLDSNALVLDFNSPLDFASKADEAESLRHDSKLTGGAEIAV